MNHFKKMILTNKHFQSNQRKFKEKKINQRKADDAMRAHGFLKLKKESYIIQFGHLRAKP